MSYKIPPTPYANFSSALTQVVASTTVAYPVIFESVDDALGIYQKSATVSVSAATPAVVSWTGHGLSIGAAVVFTGTVPTGMSAGTVYYIRTAGFGVDAFTISTTFGGGAVNTSGSAATPVCTCVSRFYSSESGDYMINISCIVDTTNNTAATMDIWFDKNGSNIDKTNTIVAINSANMTQVVSVPMILDLDRGDYVRLFYCASSTNFRMLATGTQANPTRPACPSIIMTIQKMSHWNG
jgi:hypothetical protein